MPTAQDGRPLQGFSHGTPVLVDAPVQPGIQDREVGVRVATARDVDTGEEWTFTDVQELVRRLGGRDYYVDKAVRSGAPTRGRTVVVLAAVPMRGVGDIVRRIEVSLHDLHPAQR